MPASEVGESNAVHLDTFHMNIEEKNYFDPIVKTGNLLCHLHCCENERRQEGRDNVAVTSSKALYHRQFHTDC